MAFQGPERYRDKAAERRIYGIQGDNQNGVFRIPSENARELWCISSNGMGWEHVSVSCRTGRKIRTPTWPEMCRVKALFWEEEDCVVQYHPPASEYVNEAEALHLWRPAEGNAAIPRPHASQVGRVAAHQQSDLLVVSDWRDPAVELPPIGMRALVLLTNCVSTFATRTPANLEPAAPVAWCTDAGLAVEVVRWAPWPTPAEAQEPLQARGVL